MSCMKELKENDLHIKTSNKQTLDKLHMYIQEHLSCSTLIVPLNFEDNYYK